MRTIITPIKLRADAPVMCEAGTLPAGIYDGKTSIMEVMLMGVPKQNAPRYLMDIGEALYKQMGNKNANILGLKDVDVTEQVLSGALKVGLP